VTLLEELELCGEWYGALSSSHDLLREIEKKLVAKEALGDVYPRRGERLAALKLTPLRSLKLLIMAQDPYPGKDGETPNAMGLAFSVRQGVKIPASLKNMHKELNADPQLKVEIPKHGDLTSWAEQGVLLWNVLLTLDAGEPMSHKKIPWGEFTQAVINVIAMNSPQLVFLSFGRESHKYAENFNSPKQRVIKTSHPSPLGWTKSAKDGSFVAFQGSRCFSIANKHLTAHHQFEIKW
jgi:uracil-DNA glycosylase